jgi:predicted N-formylglutamate amidohydrolase
MKPVVLMLSCEHAVNTVPKDHQHLFAGHESVLQTHRGLDIGALQIANHFHEFFHCPYTKASISRLLIDCNRSLTNTHCFSEFSKHLPEVDKKRLIKDYYQPFRQTTEALIKAQVAEGNQVLHLSIHSFTPEKDGIVRNAAIGLLYDHTRHAEQEVARIWRGILLLQTPSYRVRMNYPYHGQSDGFTSSLRKQYTEHEYLGFEIEINQALLVDDIACNEMAHILCLSVQELLQIL